MKRLDVFLLLLLGAVWGSSYTFVRIALPFLSPVFIMSLRIVLAAVVLTALLAGFADLPDFRKNWRAFLFMGAVNNAVPFIMVGAAVAGLNASIAAILNATSPLFTAMIAAVWIKEPFGPRRILGTLLGILGVVTLMGWNPLPLTPKTVVGAAAALGAAFLFGVAAVYGRLRLKGVEPNHSALGQFVFAGLILIPVSLFFLPPAAPPAKAVAVVAILAVLCTVGAYLIFFRLLSRLGAVQTSTVTFLIPFFSILWASIFLGEPLNLGMFAGLGLILVSVWLVLGEKAARPLEFDNRSRG